MVYRMNTHPFPGCYEHVFESLGHSITPRRGPFESEAVVTVNDRLASRVKDSREFGGIGMRRVFQAAAKSVSEDVLADVGAADQVGWAPLGAGVAVAAPVARSVVCPV